MPRTTPTRNTQPINPNKPVGTRHTQPATLQDLQTRLSRDLPKLLPLWPHEIDLKSAASRQLLQSKLENALRAERTRGHAGHWAYDLSRHTQLLKAYRALKNARHAPATVTTPATKKAARDNNLQPLKKPRIKPAAHTAALLFAPRPKSHLLGKG